MIYWKLELFIISSLKRVFSLKPQSDFFVALFKCREPRPEMGEAEVLGSSSSVQRRYHVNEGDQNPNWRGPTYILLLLFRLFNKAEKFPIWGKFPNSATQIIHFISSRKRTRFQFRLSGKKQEALLTDIYLPGWVPRGSFLSQEEPSCEGWRLALNLNFSTDCRVTSGKALYVFEPWFSHLKNENFLSFLFGQCSDDDVLVDSTEMPPLPGFYSLLFLCSKYFILHQGLVRRHKAHNNLKRAECNIRNYSTLIGVTV